MQDLPPLLWNHGLNKDSAQFPPAHTFDLASQYQSWVSKVRCMARNVGLYNGKFFFHISHREQWQPSAYSPKGKTHDICHAMSPLLCIFYKLPQPGGVPHRERDCPTDMQSPPAASPAHAAAPNLQRGLRHIQHPQLLRDPAALAGEAACCWHRWLPLGVRSYKSLPFHCQLVLFLKRCSGISLISHAVVAIKKAARKLGNRFLRVKDKKGKHSNSKENLKHRPYRANMNLFLTLTLPYDRIYLTEDKTGTLLQIYKDFFYLISLGISCPQHWGWNSGNRERTRISYSLSLDSLAHTSTCNTHISICA